VNAFLAQCDYCVEKWKILGIIDEGGNRKPEFFYNIGIFMVKMSMKHGGCLSGYLGTHLSLLVVFMDIYFITHVYLMLNLIVLLFGVSCVILLTLMLIHFHILHTMLVLIHLYL